MSITTVASCKTFRGIESDNQEHDSELARLIESVQAFLEEECGRVFEAGDVTEYFDGDEWCRRILVARPPINSITNIWDDPARVYATPLVSTTYGAHEAKAGIVRLLDGRRFSAGQHNIKITYNGGYTSIPLDLEQAAIEMVWAAREKGQHNLIGVRSRSIADGNVQFVNLDWGSPHLVPIIQKYSLKTGFA
jgi:hypothetical protein